MKESTEHSCKESSPDDSVQFGCVNGTEKCYIHEQEIRELKERVLSLEEVQRAVQEKADHLNAKYKRKNNELLNRITILERNLQKAHNERDALKEKLKSSKSVEDSQENVGLPERRARSQNGETLSNGKKRKTKIRMERDSLKKDNESLRMRLSEIAGSLVLDRNPSIADLSDNYRPSKLADSFSELYDNEWTDAFEEQEGNEKEAIQKLLTILVNIHKKCRILGSKYLLALEESSITLPWKGRKILDQTAQIPPVIRKFLLEIRKNLTPLIIPILTQCFQEMFIGKTEESFKDRKATSRYIETCTQLCWYMAIKDPPVVLGPIPNEEDIVNKDLFSFYTSSGTHVHFCVWPPLLLHKGGSLLRKGVIQGK
ncbi:hypothetical protein ACJMK2_031549 [Sinanodonta woodiana]